MSVAYLHNEHIFRLLKSGLIVMGYYFLSTRNGDCTNLVWKRKNIMTVPKPLQQGNIYSCTFMKMFMYTTENLLIQIRFRFWVRVWQEGRQNRNLSPTTLWSTHSEIILNPLMPTHVCALLATEWFNFCNFSCFRPSHARSKTTSTNVHESTKIGQQITYKRGQTFKAPSLSYNDKLFFLM